MAAKVFDFAIERAKRRPELEVRPCPCTTCTNREAYDAQYGLPQICIDCGARYGSLMRDCCQLCGGTVTLAAEAFK